MPDATWVEAVVRFELRCPATGTTYEYADPGQLVPFRDHDNATAAVNANAAKWPSQEDGTGQARDDAE